MEIEKEYTVLFNTITDVISKLEELIRIGSECLQKLKEAQKTSEEMHIGG